MSTDHDDTEMLCERVQDAAAGKTPLVIRAGDSKSFYGRTVQGKPLTLTSHRGILSYRASELVITARCGTRIADIEAALDEHGQQLAFEPPRHSAQSTIGGAVACGLSGPSRPFYGAARDFVLGAKIINGKGELMQFGGQVMKNVAGYDLSRLMVGAQGTLGVILEVSIKVLPKSEAETTLVYEIEAAAGHQKLRDWLGRGLPISASCHYQGLLTVRLNSTENSIRDSRTAMGGEETDSDIWQQLRDQTHPGFHRKNLWRLSLPPAAPIDNEDDQLIEWAGALRWQTSDNELFDKASGLGGHATRYTLGSDTSAEVFQPLSSGMLAIHKRIRHALDPDHILNPGRLYQEL